MFFKEFDLPTAPRFPNLEVKISDFGAVENVEISGKGLLEENGESWWL